jgi:hypothetical protein
VTATLHLGIAPFPGQQDVKLKILKTLGLPHNVGTGQIIAALLKDMHHRGADVLAGAFVPSCCISTQP